MPIARRNRTRLTSLAEVKTYLTNQITRYQSEESDRLSKAAAAQDEGQFVDSATFLAVAAKKKIVHQKFARLLSYIS